jgi:hypothetical protein
MAQLKQRRVFFTRTFQTGHYGRRPFLIAETLPVAQVQQLVQRSLAENPTMAPKRSAFSKFRRAT